MLKYIYSALLMFAVTQTAHAEHDHFPTDETVRFVVGCMAELGGQSEENLYTCVCRIETLSSLLTYEEYDGGNMMERHKSMPGKKGGFFRDNKHGDELLAKLLKAREVAFTQCPTVKRIEIKRD